jgi:hypothetical protein
MYLMWSTHSNLSRSPHEVKEGPYTRKKSWQPKQTGPTVILGHLTLPPSRRPWSRGERFQPSGYTATSAYWAHIPACTRYVQYLLTEVNPSVLNWHRRGATILEVSAFHNTLPDLSNQWSSAFHLRAPPGVRLGGVCFNLLTLFWISFREIQKLDGPKSAKLRSSWKGASSFSLFEPSSFWISQKLINKIMKSWK